MDKVAIIGAGGWVGRSMQQLFPKAVKYDVDIGTKQEVNECDVAFICVPTPNPLAGRLDTSIVEECVSWCSCPLIVIRSTINPGDSDSFKKKYGKRIVVQPEYLGETPNHPLLDTTKRQFIIMGGDKSDTRKLINLYTSVYNANVNIRQVSNLEAEVIKLTENRAIAFKLAECQELYDACEAAGVDYYVVREAVYSDDPRFSLWWTFIMPQKRGFSSKCIPKDVYAWAAWAESVKVDHGITNSILKRNLKWIFQ